MWFCSIFGAVLLEFLFLQLYKTNLFVACESIRFSSGFSGSSFEFHPLGTDQGLLAAKSCVAKKGLTIPIIELVSAHLASNLVAKVKDAVQGQPIISLYGWLDRTVVLHWIKGGGSIYEWLADPESWPTEILTEPS